MLSIARPERDLVLDGCRRDERIGCFETMAFGVLMKELPGLPTGFVIGIRTCQQAEAESNRLVFLWSGTFPDFSRSHR